MDKTPKLSGYAWILFAIAAALMFPPFMPTTYLLPLFVMRLVGAVALAGLAYMAFKRRILTSLPPLVQTAAVMAALAGGLYVASEGVNLASPDDKHIQTLVEASLNSQGGEINAGYTGVTVSDTQCYSHSPEYWGCNFSVAYNSPALSRDYVDGFNSIQVSKQSGERLTGDDRGCEFNFQWMNRIRVSPYYTDDLEPVWLGPCFYDHQGKAFERTVMSVRGQERDLNDIWDGVTFKVFENNPVVTTLRTLKTDTAESLIKKAINGDIERISCEDTSAKPSADSISCFVSGTKVVWEDNSLASVGMDMSVTGDFSSRVTLVPEGLKWVVKR